MWMLRELQLSDYVAETGILSGIVEFANVFRDVTGDVWNQREER